MKDLKTISEKDLLRYAYEYLLEMAIENKTFQYDDQLVEMYSRLSEIKHCEGNRNEEK